jgi:hypothetical protein
MKKLILTMVLVFGILGCSESKDKQVKTDLLRDMQQLIDENRFEEARLAALDTLDPDIRALYYKADDQLGHAAHADVDCNTRIEEVLSDIAKSLQTNDIKSNQVIYSNLLILKPENETYKKKYIYYDRKVRGVKN